MKIDAFVAEFKDIKPHSKSPLKVRFIIRLT